MFNFIKNLKLLFNHSLFNFPPLFLVIIITSFLTLMIEIFIGMGLFIEKTPEIQKVCFHVMPATNCTHPPLLLAIFYVIVKYTSQSTIILMIVTFIYLLINWISVYLREIKNSQPEKFMRKDVARPLVEILIGCLSVGAIPTGISLIVCGFYNINLIQYMSGVEMYIVFAGIAIISIGYLSTMRQQAQIDERK